MHPLLDEFCRAHVLQPVPFRRMQRLMRSDIAPMLDERDRLLEENAQLRAEIATLTAQLEQVEVRRGPGRPRKVEAVAE